MEIGEKIKSMKKYIKTEAIRIKNLPDANIIISEIKIQVNKKLKKFKTN